MNKTSIRPRALGAVAIGTATALLLPALPASAASPAAEVACELELLPEPDETERSFTSQIDPTGTWVGGRIYPDDGPEVRIWHDGEVIDPQVPGADQQLLDINSSGTAVGLTYRGADSGSVAWVHAQAEDVTFLPEPDDDSRHLWARGVNSDGVIVGVSLADGLKEVNALMWPDAASDPVILELPDDAVAGDARDVSEDGTVVGFYVNGDDERIPYTWDADGNGEPLPELDTGSLTGVANEIAGEWIIGIDESRDVPVVWEPGAEYAAFVPELDGVNGVSPNGDLSGHADGYGAVLPAAGEAVQLPGMVDHDGEDFESAEAMSADGSTIVGHVVDENGDLNYHGGLWHCQ